MSPWQPGHVVVRREILKGRIWVGFATYVVADTPDLLAVYIAPGSEIGFADGPVEQWDHPWRTGGLRRWTGHGKLMLHRPGDAYSVDVFWSGEDRRFDGWYFNLQDPFVRREQGFDTLDHELDYWLPAGGRWRVKDYEAWQERVRAGFYTPAQAELTRRTAEAVVAMLESGSFWFDAGWADWQPPRDWVAQRLPDGWDS